MSDAEPLNRDVCGHYLSESEEVLGRCSECVEVDRKLLAGASYLCISAIFSLFGIIHSVDPKGSLYLPWRIGGDLHLRIGIGYAAFALLLLALSCLNRDGGVPANHATNGRLVVERRAEGSQQSSAFNSETC